MTVTDSKFDTKWWAENHFPAAAHCPVSFSLPRLPAATLSLHPIVALPQKVPRIHSFANRRMTGRAEQSEGLVAITSLSRRTLEEILPAHMV